MMPQLCRIMILVFIAHTLAPELLWAQRASMKRTELQQKVQQVTEQMDESYDSVDGTTPEGFATLVDLINKKHAAASPKKQTSNTTPVTQTNNRIQSIAQVQDGQLYTASQQQQRHATMIYRSSSAQLFLRDLERGKYDDPAQLIDAMDEWGASSSALTSAYAAEVLLNGTIQPALTNPGQLDKEIISFLLPRIQARALHSLNRFTGKNITVTPDFDFFEGIVAARGTLRILLLQTHKLYQALGMDDPLTTQVTQTQNTYTVEVVRPTLKKYKEEMARLRQEAQRRPESKVKVITPSYQTYCKARTSLYNGQKIPAGYEKVTETQENSSQNITQNEQIFAQFMQDFVNEIKELQRDGKTDEGDTEFAYLTLHIQYVGRYALLYPKGTNSLPKIVTLLEHEDAPKDEEDVTDFEMNYGQILDSLFATLAETPKILPIPSENVASLKKKLVELAGPKYATAVRVYALMSAGLLNQVGLLAGTETSQEAISSTNPNPGMAFSDKQRQTLVSYAVDLYAPTISRPTIVYTNVETIPLIGDITMPTSRPSIDAVWGDFLPVQRPQKYYGLDSKQIPVFQRQITDAIANLLPVMACDYTLSTNTWGLPMPIYKDKVRRTGCAKTVKESCFPAYLDHHQYSGCFTANNTGSLVEIPWGTNTITATIYDPLFLLDSKGDPFDVYQGGRPNRRQEMLDQLGHVGRFFLEAALWAFGGEIFIFGIRALQMTTAGVRLLPNALKAGKTIYTASRAARKTQQATQAGKTIYTASRAARKTQQATQVGAQIVKNGKQISQTANQATKTSTVASTAGTTGTQVPPMLSPVGKTRANTSKINAFGTKLRGFGQDVWAGTKALGLTSLENMWLGGSTTGFGFHIGASFFTTRLEPVLVNGVKETRYVTRLGSGSRSPMAIDLSQEFGSKGFWRRLFSKTPETQYITIAQGDQVFTFTRQQLLDMGIANVDHLRAADKVKIWKTAINNGLEVNPWGRKYPWLIRPFDFKFWLGSTPNAPMFGMGGDSGTGAAKTAQKTAPVKKALQTLGLDENATPSQVKKAYRKAALEVHPDRNPEKGAEAFREVIGDKEILDKLFQDAYKRLGLDEAEQANLTVKEALGSGGTPAGVLGIPGKAPTPTETILKNMANRYFPAFVQNVKFFALWELWDLNLYPLQKRMIQNTLEEQSEEERNKYGDLYQSSPYDAPLDLAEQGNDSIESELDASRDDSHDYEGALISTPIIGASILFGKNFMKGNQATQLRIGANNIALNRALTKNEERQLAKQLEGDLKIWKETRQQDKTNSYPQLRRIIPLVEEILTVLKNPNEDTKGLESFKEDYKKQHQGKSQGYRRAYLQKLLEDYATAQESLTATHQNLQHELYIQEFNKLYNTYRSYIGSDYASQAQKVLQEMDRIRPSIEKIFKNGKTLEEQVKQIENLYNDPQFRTARDEFEVTVGGENLKKTLRQWGNYYEAASEFTKDLRASKEYKKTADEVNRLIKQIESTLNGPENLTKKLQLLKDIENKASSLWEQTQKRIDQGYKADLQKNNAKLFQSANTEERRTWINEQVADLEKVALNKAVIQLPAQRRLVEQTIKRLKKIVAQPKITSDQCVQVYKDIKQLDNDILIPSAWPPYETQEAKEQINEWYEQLTQWVTIFEGYKKQLEQAKLPRRSERLLEKYITQIQQITSNAEAELAKVWMSKGTTKVHQQNGKKVLEGMSKEIQKLRDEFIKEINQLLISSSTDKIAYEELYPDVNVPIYTGM